MLLAWPRAILLQVAHPLVAAGVAGHSSFADGGFAAVHRLWQTVQAMLALSFGDRDEQADAIDGILAIHYRVRGALRETVGRFPAGTRYSAEDPDLVLWVHVTLLDSMVLAHDALLEPLSAAERDAYCTESAWVAGRARAPARTKCPPPGQRRRPVCSVSTRRARWRWGRTAARSGDAVLSPPLGPLAVPLTAIVRFITRAWLPDEIRSLYGLSWSEADARRLPRVLKALRAARRLLPNRAARWPESRDKAGRSVVGRGFSRAADGSEAPPTSAAALSSAYSWLTKRSPVPAALPVCFSYEVRDLRGDDLLLRLALGNHLRHLIPQGDRHPLVARRCRRGW